MLALSTSTSGSVASLSSGLSTTHSGLTALSTSTAVSVASLSTAFAPIVDASEEAAKSESSIGVTKEGGSNQDGTSQTYGTGGTARASSLSTVIVASCSKASGIDSTAAGLCSQAKGTGATSYGSNAQATAEDTTAVGNRAVASQVGSVAIGQNAQATGDPTVAVGQSAVASGNNAVALGAGAQATGSNSVALGAGSVASRADSVSVGSPGNERVITNVAPGTNWSDAANVGQLNQVAGQIGSIGEQVVNLSRAAYSGIAMSAALAGLPQVEEGKTFGIGAGLGNYAGYTSLAVGASARFGDDTIVKMGLSTSPGPGDGHVLFNMGVGYSW